MISAKYYFTSRVVKIWNSLSNHVVLQLHGMQVQAFLYTIFFFYMFSWSSMLMNGLIS